MLFFFALFTVSNAYGLESTNTLETSFEKNMPLDIKVMMVDLCHNPEKNNSKEGRWFWSTLHVKILSIIPEFNFLNGVRDSITINNDGETVRSLLCPGTNILNGTFTSINGDEHKYYLSYDAAHFEYLIDDISPPQYLNFIESPLKQFKSWGSLDMLQFKPEIIVEYIQCKENLVLIQKYDGTPACVKEQTIPKLIARGWMESTTFESLDKSEIISRAEQLPEVQLFLEKYPDVKIKVDWDRSQVKYVEEEIVKTKYGDEKRRSYMQIQFDEFGNPSPYIIGCTGNNMAITGTDDIMGQIQSDDCFKGYLMSMEE